MDYITAVVTVAHAIWDKISKLEENAHRKMEMAQQYKRALAALSLDAQSVSRQCDAIVLHGDKTAVAALFNTSPGQALYDDLQQSLKGAGSLLKNQEDAADRLLQQLQTGTPGPRNLLADLDRDWQQFSHALQQASDDLDDCRRRMLRLFGEFSRLYQTQRTREPPPTSAVQPLSPIVSTDLTRRLLDGMQQAWLDHPFAMLLDEADGLEILQELSLVTGVSSDQADVFTRHATALAEGWINENRSLQTALPDVAGVQLHIFESLSALLSADNVWNVTSMIGGETLLPALVELCGTLQRAIEREKDKKYSIAFCGMVKAGKSLFLNALMGQMLLPSDELPATAWPCRVQHVKGQYTPRLEIDQAFFQKLVERLQEKKYGAMMKTYVPPSEKDPFSFLLLGPDWSVEQNTFIPTSAELDRASRERAVYYEWVDLHPATQDNLRRFERAGYRIPESASGADHIVDLLGQVNDLVRLCHRFRIEFPDVTVKHGKRMWPTLQIDMEALRDEVFEGSFEFLDLPGVGEHSDQHFRFEDLVRTVAKEVDAVVPVLSFKDVSKNSWRQELPDIVREGTQRDPDMVLGTHLDQIPANRLREQIASIRKGFWANEDSQKHQVLCVSSRMGYSARAVLKLSNGAKPRYSEISHPGSIESECTQRVLGSLKPEETYKTMSVSKWNSAVLEQLKKSELPLTVKRLVTDMIRSSRARALKDENERLQKDLRRLMSYLSRILLPMRRSIDEQNHAFQQFQDACETLESILSQWSADSRVVQLRAQNTLKEMLIVLSKELDEAAPKAVNQTLEDLSDKVQSIGEDGMEISFDNMVVAERFLALVQANLNRRLELLKVQFVKKVRSLANRMRAHYFNTLKGKVEHVPTEDPQILELKDEITGMLSIGLKSLETLTLHSIHRKSIRKITANHDAASAFRSFQTIIARPFLRPDVSSLLTPGDTGSVTTLDDLGFMLRAPIAAVAVIPWVLGIGIWPFIPKSEKHVLHQKEFVQDLKHRIIGPFGADLEKESENTLRGMMSQSSGRRQYKCSESKKKKSQSSEEARRAVEDALDGEKRRFMAHCEQDPLQQNSPQVVSVAVSVLLNFGAAEAALQKLQPSLA